MRIRLLSLFLIQWSMISAVWAAEPQLVFVADPYLELHTGPGRGYPVFHVVERGEQVEILKGKTTWIKVRTDRGLEGWVDRSEMEQTLQPSGEKTQFESTTLEDFAERRWEMGAFGGDFGGADALSVYGGFAFTENLSVELWLTQLLGNFSNGYMITGNIVHTFFPQWRASPFFRLGTGVIHTEPKATLVQAEDRTDQFALAGAGVRTYINRRFVFRAEYNTYVVFASRDDNEEVEEWKLGFSFFF